MSGKTESQLRLRGIDGHTQHRFLVVDDYRVIAHFEAVNIEAPFPGCGAEMAHDGQEAVDKAFVLRPHVILMNRVIAKIGGFEAIRRLRADESMDRCQILMLTDQSAAGGNACVDAGRR